MSSSARRAAVLTLLALTLAGCSGSDEATPEGSSSPSSASASTQPDERAGQTATADSLTTAGASSSPGRSTETAAPTETAPPSEGADADPVDSNEHALSPAALAHFTSGGACYSDYFPAGAPSPDVLAEIQDYCATTDVSAWDLQDGAPNPFGIPDPPQDVPGATGDDGGYQRPAPDANGYVGPSEEYDGYDGYVEPGFEYQVGSQCFDADLGRCKTSGELQTKHLEGREVEDLMREQGRDVPGAQEQTAEDWTELGFGCFEDEAEGTYCVDPPPGV